MTSKSSDVNWKGWFRACPDCGHSNHLFGCDCENERCSCVLKRQE